MLPWFVLLTPLVSAALIALITGPARRLSAGISVAAVLVSFICSCIIFAKTETGAAEIPWIEFQGIFRVPIGFVLDSLSKTMLVLVSGVGALIHIYSLGYMRMTAANRATSRRSRSSCFPCSALSSPTTS